MAESIVPLRRGSSVPQTSTQPPTSSVAVETNRQPFTVISNHLPSQHETDAPTTVPPTFPCSCKSACFNAFSQEDIDDWKCQYLALDGAELDICILSKISCGMHTEESTRQSKKGGQTNRKRTRTDYFHHGHKICVEFFKYLHSIGKDKLAALQEHYRANGVESRQHKNKKRQPRHALKYEDTRRVVDFILNFAEAHAIHLPGRTPKHWITDVQLLPTDCTKVGVYIQYKSAAEESNVRVVSERTFRDLWHKLLPFIRTTKPASDLCWTCQQGTRKLMEAQNKADECKQQILKELQTHQQIVKQEREYYNEVCKKVKNQLPANATLTKNAPCSFKGSNHLSFDFAQQVHYPSNPLQPGPIFFKTPRKCGLFGVNAEAVRKQVNYLIDESQSSGKGANVVISYLHDYLENFGLGETDLHLHADNCAGQNKNNSMMQYLLWRCMTKRHETIRLSFLIAGHTKFSPDCGFGLIKRKFRRTKIDCLRDIQRVVDLSSEMNISRLVGSERGNTEVVTYDWTNFLSQYYRKLKKIKQFHHFFFEASGNVKAQANLISPCETENIVKKLPDTTSLPQIIPANGLSIQRQWYLYQDIRPFVAEEFQDLVAPRPSVELHAEQSSSSDDEHEQPSAPPTKVARASISSRGRSRGRGRGRGKS